MLSVHECELKLQKLVDVVLSRQSDANRWTMFVAMARWPDLIGPVITSQGGSMIDERAAAAAAEEEEFFEPHEDAYAAVLYTMLRANPNDVVELEASAEHAAVPSA
jgi:hypothetical protein